MNEATDILWEGRRLDEGGNRRDWVTIEFYSFEIQPYNQLRRLSLRDGEFLICTKIHELSV